MSDLCIEFPKLGTYVYKIIGLALLISDKTQDPRSKPNVHILKKKTLIIFYLYILLTGSSNQFRSYHKFFNS
jgi:hypothetical protein